MKKSLNPKLVRVQFYQDLEKTFESRVILRDSEDRGEHKEVGIGSQELDVITADAEEIAEFKESLREDTKAAGEAQSGDPFVLLAKDCFGFQGPVRILIYSDAPFSGDPNA